LDHLLEADFELGEHPLDLFLAKLAEDFFEILPGGLEFAEGSFLILNSPFPFRLVEIFNRLAHAALGLSGAFSGRGGITTLLLRLLATFTALAALASLATLPPLAAHAPFTDPAFAHPAFAHPPFAHA